MAEKDGLYQYDPGDGSVRYTCPFLVENTLVRAFDVLGQTEGNVLELLDSKNPVQQAEGAEFVCKATRKAFETVPFNGMTGEGLSEAGAMELYKNFRNWSFQKKTSGGSSPTSPPSSGSPSSESPAPSPYDTACG